MSDSCTIFCLKNDPEQVVSLVNSDTSADVEVIRGDQSWEKIILKTGDYRLALSNLFRKEPGDSFSRLILSTHNYFMNIKTTATTQQQVVLDHISNTQLMIGVVGEPGFTENSRHSELIFEVAKHLDGFIFNGNGMLDNNGYIILDDEGVTEVEAF